jgi:hypothetical protein
MKMEAKLQLTIRTVAKDRQASVAAPFDATAGEILASACDNWNLSGEYEYVIRCERLGSRLAENVTLAQAGIREGDVLEIQPFYLGG